MRPNCTSEGITGISMCKVLIYRQLCVFRWTMPIVLQLRAECQSCLHWRMCEWGDSRGEFGYVTLNVTPDGCL